MNDDKTKCIPLRIPFDRKNTILLAALVQANPKQRRGILEHSDHSFIHCICEIVLNYLNGVLTLKNSEKKKLKKYRVVLRKLISKISWSSKKKIILKHCINTILISLITPIISLLLRNFS